jgi:hypothetical protein
LKPLVAIKRFGCEALRRLGQPTVHGTPRFSLFSGVIHWDMNDSCGTPLGAHRFQRPWLPLRSLIEARQPEAMRTQGRFSLFPNVGTRHEGYAEDQPRISYGNGFLWFAVS